MKTLMWLALVATVGIAACSKSKDPGEKGGQTEAQLLEQVGRQVIAPSAQEFKKSAEALSARLEKHCFAQRATDTTGVDTVSLAATQDAWKAAMSAYHRMGAMSLGPVLERGRYLADHIYSWPYVNTCGVDLTVVEMAAGQVDPRLLHTVKGLGALEYLLFEKDLGTTCNPNSVRSKPALEWMKKDVKQKAIDRCQYAEFIAKDLVLRAGELADAWDPAKGDFTRSMIDGSKYESLKAAVNALSDAMFSVEKMKDERLAKPLGLHKECTSPSRRCPEKAEHVWADASFDAIEAELISFRRVFTGSFAVDSTEGFGFDDYLRAMSREAVAERMLEDIDRALDSVRAVRARGSLRQQIQTMDAGACQATTTANRQVEACAVYQDVREITTRLKTEFLTALSLNAPPVFQGDND